MKESIGATQIFLLVIALVLIFSGIMALTINRSNAFAVKDQIVTILEEAGSFDMRSQITSGSRVDEKDPLQKIVNLLEHNSYRQTGTCPEYEDSDNEVVAYQRNGAQVMGNDKASFCIVKIDGKSPSGSAPVYYYQIVVFYTLDLPVLNSIFNFRVVGETKALRA